MAIHKTAIIDSAAEIDSSVEIGPYAVIDGPVRIGSGCRVMSHAFITSNTTLGPDNVIYPFAVIGAAPQDLSYHEEKSYLQIGKGNTIREGVSIHRGSKEGSATEVGDNNFIMGYSHIAHDCIIGNEVVIANGALLAGHVHIDNQVFISGNVVIHQFCAVGRLAMLSGLARISKGVPPFMTVVERNSVVGLNVVGLKRAGFTQEERGKVKRAFKLLYHSGLNVKQAVEAIKRKELGPGAEAIIDFIARSKRGICGAA
ncbi:MAG: acyl-ACP--UDP-N-acetylglucosamine O-acyltransferase [Candidatus Auribacterota bacterium]|nr:acyl-ACP--UDP-N-acetylglucosamine O-acyltransferase [Candidatus Auribacterota bacterium]